MFKFAGTSRKFSHQFIYSYQMSVAGKFKREERERERKKGEREKERKERERERKERER